MQNQQMNINTPVHVKVALNGEFRRFLLNPLTFANLETTVKTLFSINAPVSLKFEDDEKDWVVVATDAELLYAIELVRSPLRVDVKILAHGSAEKVPEAAQGGWRGRGGRRGGRGGRGGCNAAERLAQVETRVTGKIAELQEKLNSGKLTSERERAVRWKLTRLQEKLEFVAAKRATLDSAKSEETPKEETPKEEPQTPKEEIKTCDEVTEDEPQEWGRRGGRGRGGRGGRGRGGRRGACADGDGEGEGFKPRGGFMKLLPPEIKENFHQCKAAWRAAKESGDAEQMAACKEAFWAAKEAKCAALAALRAQDAAGEGQETKTA